MSKTIVELAKELKMRDDEIYFIAKICGISEKSGYILTDKEISRIEELINHKPLKIVIQRYFDITDASLQQKKDIAIERLQAAKEQGFREGVLQALVQEISRLEGIMTMRNGVRERGIANLEELKDYAKSLLLGDDCLDKFPTTVNPSPDRFTPPGQPLLTPPLNETEAKLVEFVRQMIATDRTNL
jgi:hypothetical protein